MFGHLTTSWMKGLTRRGLWRFATTSMKRRIPHSKEEFPTDVLLRTSEIFGTIVKKYLWETNLAKEIEIEKCVSFLTRSSHWFVLFGKSLSKLKKQPPEVLYKKAVLKNFAKFTGKNRSLFLNKVAGLRPFPMNFAKFLKTSFSQNTSRPRLLEL